MPAQKPGPSRNVQSWKATSDCPAIVSVSGIGAGAGELLAQGEHREDADDAGDDDRPLDDAQRDVAERGARGRSAWRRGYSAIAVPMLQIAVRISSSAPTVIWVSWPAPRMYLG